MKRKPSRSVRSLMDAMDPGLAGCWQMRGAALALRWALRQAATDATYEGLRDRLGEAIRELRERAK